MKKLKNHTTKTTLIIFALSLLTIGCLKKREPIKHEKGIVIEKQYCPDTRQSIVGTGLSSDGKMVTTVHFVGDYEKYIVIFKCEHQIVFSISRPEVYGKVKKDDKVIIDYYEMVNDKGEVKDFDFVDATPY